MSLAALATLLVSLAFMGLCVWVLLPGNKSRFERHGRIPFSPENSTDDQEEPRR